MFEFTYLDSQMISDGELNTEVEKRIATASRAFGALCHAVFRDRTLSVLTKKLCTRHVYSVYYFMKLDISDTSFVWITFTIRTILGISKKQQWEQQIRSEATCQMWGDPETISDKLIRHQVRMIGTFSKNG